MWHSRILGKSCTLTDTIYLLCIICTQDGSFIHMSQRRIPKNDLWGICIRGLIVCSWEPRVRRNGSFCSDLKITWRRKCWLGIGRGYRGSRIRDWVLEVDQLKRVSYSGWDICLRCLTLCLRHISCRRSFCMTLGTWQVLCIPSSRSCIHSFTSRWILWWSLWL